MAQLIRLKNQPNRKIYHDKICLMPPNNLITNHRFSDAQLRKDKLQQEIIAVRESVALYVFKRKEMGASSQSRSTRNYYAKVAIETLNIAVGWLVNFHQEIDAINALGKKIAENICRSPITYGVNSSSINIEAMMRIHFKISLSVSGDKIGKINENYRYLLSVINDKAFLKTHKFDTKSHLDLFVFDKKLNIAFDERDLDRVLTAVQRKFMPPNGLNLT